MNTKKQTATVTPIQKPPCADLDGNNRTEGHCEGPYE